VSGKENSSEAAVANTPRFALLVPEDVLNDYLLNLPADVKLQLVQQRMDEEWRG